MILMLIYIYPGGLNSDRGIPISTLLLRIEHLTFSETFLLGSRSSANDVSHATVDRIKLNTDEVLSSEQRIGTFLNIQVTLNKDIGIPHMV